MHGRLYRGTSLTKAKQEEFADGTVHGEAFDVVSGFMDPDDIDRDYSGQYVSELPWEVGPEFDTVHVVGGISERLGAAYNFATGAVPVVFHLDAAEIADLARVGYSYQWFDSFEGGMPWYDGQRTGELRINGDLQGLLARNPDDDTQAIAYYGDDLVSRAQDYSDELEMLTHGERVDIGDAIDMAVTYVRRPIAAVSAIEGYSRVASRLAEDRGDTIVGDWSDERALEVLYDELRSTAPSWMDVYAVNVETDLVMESWGYEQHQIAGAHGASGRMSPTELPQAVYGD